MRRRSFCCEPNSIAHTKPVLLVDDHEREILELNIILKHGMSTGQHLNTARLDVVQNALARFSFIPPGEADRANTERSEDRTNTGFQLSRKNFCGRHDNGLFARRDRKVERKRSNGRFTSTDIALKHALHRVCILNVCGYFPASALLCGRHWVRK